MESGNQDESVVPDPADFWAQYALPFEFETAYKYRRHEIKHGQTSPGVELDRAVHLFCLERVIVPGSVVEAGSYYCDDTASYHHAEYGPEGGLIVEDDSGTHPRPVTCNKCRKGMRRWKNDE